MPAWKRRWASLALIVLSACLFCGYFLVSKPRPTMTDMWNSVEERSRWNIRDKDSHLLESSHNDNGNVGSCPAKSNVFPRNLDLYKETDLLKAQGVQVVSKRDHNDYYKNITFGVIYERKFWDYCKVLNPYKWPECPITSNSHAKPADGVPKHLSRNRRQKVLCTKSSYVVEIPCSFVELWGSMNKHVAGNIFDQKRTFNPQLFSRTVLTNYDAHIVGNYTELGVAIFPYATEKGHFVHETLSRVVWLLETLPKHVPILAPGGTWADKYLQILSRNGFDITRILPYEYFPNSVIFAQRIYLPIEYPFCHQEGNPNVGGESTEYPYEIMRSLHKALVPTDFPAHHRKTLLLIKRDGVARSLIEHELLLFRLESVYEPQGYNIQEFGQSFWGKPLQNHIDIFNSAAVVIAPHGAGLANIVFCAENTAVIEIGYDSDDIMSLDEMYYQLSVGLHLRYWLVLGKGSYVSEISVRVDDVIEAVTQAIAMVQPNIV